MAYLRNLVDHVVESFSNVFRFETLDPALGEAENVDKVIRETSTVAACISCIQPIPMADILVLTPLQTKMALQVGKIKGFEVSHERAQEMVREIIGTVWMSVAAQVLIGSFSKVIPIAGAIMTAPLNYAATFAIGKVVDYYFDCLREGEVPSSEVMKDLFAEQFKVGKKQGQDLDKDDLQRKADELRRKVAARDPDLVTETRLKPDPLRGAGASAVSAATDAPTTAAPSGAGRPKIKITLGDAREAAATSEAAGGAGAGGADAEAAPPPPMRKTIGPEVEGPPAPTTADAATSPGADPDDRTEAARAAGDPDAPTEAARADDGTATEVGSVAAARGRPDHDDPSALVEQLERLARLRDVGVLSPDEFELAKRKLLG